MVDDDVDPIASEKDADRRPRRAGLGRCGGWCVRNPQEFIEIVDHILLTQANANTPGRSRYVRRNSSMRWPTANMPTSWFSSYLGSAFDPIVASGRVTWSLFLECGYVRLSALLPGGGSFRNPPD